MEPFARIFGRLNHAKLKHPFCFSVSAEKYFPDVPANSRDLIAIQNRFDISDDTEEIIIIDLIIGTSCLRRFKIVDAQTCPPFCRWRTSSNVRPGAESKSAKSSSSKKKMLRPIRRCGICPRSIPFRIAPSDLSRIRIACFIPHLVFLTTACCANCRIR